MSTAAPTPHFQYERLPNRDWIRLLRLCADTESGDVSCNLKLFGPGNCPDYIAVSYRWGESKSKHRIYVNNLVKEVGQNLWRLMRRISLNKDDHWYWIDSICINQDHTRHDSERSEQVARMGSIYTQAQSVLSWLIECPSGADALKTVMDPKSTKDHCSPTDVAIYRSILRLLKEDYWHRVWVIQEIACGQTVSVVCGSTAFDFDILADRIASRLRYLGSESSLKHKLQNPEFLELNNHWIFKLVNLRDDVKQGNHIRLAELIKRFPNCESSIPLDRVYGLLGLAGRLDPGFEPTRLEVDYSKTLEQVFWDTLFLTSETIATQPGFDLLSTAAVPDGVSDIKYDTSRRLEDYANAATTTPEERRTRARRAGNVFAAVVSGLNPDGRDIDMVRETKLQLERPSFHPSAPAAVKKALSHAHQHLTQQQSTNDLVQGSLIGLSIAAHSLEGRYYEIAPPLPHSPAWNLAIHDSEPRDEEAISSFSREDGVSEVGSEASLKDASLMISDLGLLLHVKHFKEIHMSSTIFYCTLCQRSDSANYTRERLLESRAQDAKMVNEKDAELRAHHLFQLDADYRSILMERVSNPDHEGGQMQITERDFRVAAMNSHFGKEIILKFLASGGNQIQMTEDVLKTVARNEGCGEEITAILLKEKEDQIQITEDILKAVVENKGRGEKIMAAILEKKGDQIQITEDVLKTAAKNEGCGEKIIATLLENKGDQIQVTEGILKAVVGNGSRGEKMMAILLDKKGDQIHVTDGVIRAALGNSLSGKDIMALLFKEKGDTFRVSQDMVVAAVAAGEGGKGILAFLRDKSRLDKI